MESIRKKEPYRNENATTRAEPKKEKTQTARRRLESSQENFNNNIEKHVREPNALRIMFFINHNIFGSLVVYIGYLLLMM